METLIPNNQKGFQKGLSVEDNLLELKGRISDGMESNKCVAVGFIDLSKAFDKVNRNTLLRILKHKGFSGKLFNYLNFFLGKREFFVRYKGKESKIGIQGKGVPQGSCISPTLFNIYTSEITERKNILAFADDIAAVTSGDNAMDAMNKLEKEIRSVKIICKKLEMEISQAKSSFMIFNSTTKKKKLLIDDEYIQRKKAHKYLGVIIDEKLNFTKHVDSVVGKAMKKAYTFKALTNRISGCVGWKLQRIYTTYIRPVWEFAPNVWHNISTKSFDKIKALQQIFLCWSLGIPSWTARYQVNWQSNTLPVEERLNEIYIRSFIKRRNQNKNGEKSIDLKAKKLIEETGIHLNVPFKKEELKRLIWDKYKKEIINSKDKCYEETLNKKIMFRLSNSKSAKRKTESFLHRIRLDTLPFTANRVNNIDPLCQKNKMKRSHLLFDCKKFAKLRKRKFGKKFITNEVRKVFVLSNKKYEEKLMTYFLEVSKELRKRKSDIKVK